MDEIRIKQASQTDPQVPSRNRGGVKVCAAWGKQGLYLMQYVDRKRKNPRPGARIVSKE